MTTDIASPLYYEDLAVGDEWDVGTVTITEDELLEFAERYDPQAFHVDEAAAERHFDGLIASGWHTAAACMRPFVETVLADVAVVAAAGVDDLRWHEPVRPDDALAVEISVVEKAPWSDDRGQVSFRLRATNDAGDPVHTRTDLVIVERRGTA
ncbi:acyl dehydratase [Halovivax ruber XH-70]|uniref:Acyl dehydratase n=1 Tax=Halovivax ruber (strain DSM 18193 / JCM 13892 / XH-70) TaxID=797302 RepID=L0IBZ8_HALRX|nr:MaoC/PaaZ C-terminal domain-containing protein [Halovivax ruber]AGB17100.1 acyl dehydratase [Halovivax ruber XH-70]